MNYFTYHDVNIHVFVHPPEVYWWWEMSVLQCACLLVFYDHLGCWVAAVWSLGVLDELNVTSALWPITVCNKTVILLTWYTLYTCIKQIKCWTTADMNIGIHIHGEGRGGYIGLKDMKKESVCITKWKRWVNELWTYAAVLDSLLLSPFKVNMCWAGITKDRVHWLTPPLSLKTDTPAGLA